jgi:hypothetical protein
MSKQNHIHSISSGGKEWEESKDEDRREIWGEGF